MALNEIAANYLALTTSYTTIHILKWAKAGGFDLYKTNKIIVDNTKDIFIKINKMNPIYIRDKIFISLKTDKFWKGETGIIIENDELWFFNFEEGRKQEPDSIKLHPTINVTIFYLKKPKWDVYLRNEMINEIVE